MFDTKEETGDKPWKIEPHHNYLDGFARESNSKRDNYILNKGSNMNYLTFINNLQIIKPSQIKINKNDINNE